VSPGCVTGMEKSDKLFLGRPFLGGQTDDRDQGCEALTLGTTAVKYCKMKDEKKAKCFFTKTTNCLNLDKQAECTETGKVISSKGATKDKCGYTKHGTCKYEKTADNTAATCVYNAAYCVKKDDETVKCPKLTGGLCSQTQATCKLAAKGTVSTLKAGGLADDKGSCTTIPADFQSGDDMNGGTVQNEYSSNGICLATTPAPNALTKICAKLNGKICGDAGNDCNNDGKTDGTNVGIPATPGAACLVADHGKLSTLGDACSGTLASTQCAFPAGAQDDCVSQANTDQCTGGIGKSADFSTCGDLSLCTYKAGFDSNAAGHCFIVPQDTCVKKGTNEGGLETFVECPESSTNGCADDACTKCKTDKCEIAAADTYCGDQLNCEVKSAGAANAQPTCVFTASYCTLKGDDTKKCAGLTAGSCTATGTTCLLRAVGYASTSWLSTDKTQCEAVPTDWKSGDAMDGTVVKQHTHKPAVLQVTCTPDTEEVLGTPEGRPEIRGTCTATTGNNEAQLKAVGLTLEANDVEQCLYLAPKKFSCQKTSWAAQDGTCKATKKTEAFADKPAHCKKNIFGANAGKVPV